MRATAGARLVPARYFGCTELCPGAGSRRRKPGGTTDATGRDPHTAGYVSAKELPDGTIPPANADGNFIIGPTHNPAAPNVLTGHDPEGKVVEFTMNSADSKFLSGHRA